MKRAITSLIAFATVAAASVAAPIQFDLKDPKGVNNIVFLLDAPLESINGTATGISGTVSFDPAKPESTSGSIAVAVGSLTVPNPKMQEHLVGDRWLNASSYPEIGFDLKKLSKVKKDGKKLNAVAHGVLTIHGVSKEMEIPVSLTYLEDMLAKRHGKQEGDILVVRSDFTVKRSDFGINSGNMEDKVSDEVALRLSLAGFAPDA